jgi:hypothetical protein
MKYIYLLLFFSSCLNTKNINALKSFNDPISNKIFILERIDKKSTVKDSTEGTFDLKQMNFPNIYIDFHLKKHSKHYNTGIFYVSSDSLNLNSKYHIDIQTETYYDLDFDKDSVSIHWFYFNFYRRPNKRYLFKHPLEHILRGALGIYGKYIFNDGKLIIDGEFYKLTLILKK